MRHVGKERALCPVGGLSSTDCLSKGLIHFLVRGTVRHNQDIFLRSVYITVHCDNMKPAPLPCFLMNIFKIPFPLFLCQDILQIILIRIFRIPGMQLSQNADILLDLLYGNAQQSFHIRAYIIGLIRVCIQHQKHVIHIHRQLLKQLIPVQDLHILSLQASPVFLKDQSDQKGSDTAHDCPHKEHRTKLQIVHAGIDDIGPDQTQKYPVLKLRFFINQIVIPAIQIYEHRIGTFLFPLLRKVQDLCFRHIGMLSQDTQKIIHVPP